MSTSSMLPAAAEVSEEDLKLEEEEEDPSPAAESVSLDVASDSAIQRAEQKQRVKDSFDDKHVVHNHQFSVIVDAVLLLVVLLGVYLSEKASVVSVPIVTTTQCTMHTGHLQCKNNLVETSFNVGILTVAMLCVFFLEDLICGCILPAVYIRLARARANYIGSVSAWIALSLLQVQAAMLAGYLDPRMFCVFPVFMACFYVVAGLSGANRAKAFCVLLLFLQSVLLVVGTGLETNNFIWWIVCLLVLEYAYFYCFLSPTDWFSHEHRLLIMSVVIRSCNAVWLFIVLIAVPA